MPCRYSNQLHPVLIKLPSVCSKASSSLLALVAALYFYPLDFALPLPTEPAASGFSLLNRHSVPSLPGLSQSPRFGRVYVPRQRLS